MILHSCPVFVFFYFLNAKCWRAWLRRPAKILADKDCCPMPKIVAKSASRDQKYASSANIKQFHFWKLQKNLTWQQIIFSYQKLHYTIHLHNLQRNASFMCWFKCLKWPKCNIFESVCQLFTPIIRVHILLVYKQEVWPPYSALTSDWVHISPQQQYIAFFS